MAKPTEDEVILHAAQHMHFSVIPNPDSPFSHKHSLDLNLPTCKGGIIVPVTWLMMRERELFLEDFDLVFAPMWNSYIFIVLVVMFGKETHRQSIL